MQFAIWLLGLTCHLSPLVRGALQQRLHPKQERFIKQLSSYEITTPLRVNDFGESFPHALHFRRRRRSADDELSGARLHYRVDAFGELFHLNLTADSSFIAPSYAVKHLGGERDNGTEPRAHDMRHCFFRGHVNAKREHPAVFSLCSGLIGTFTTQHGEYFMEPLLTPDGDEYEEAHNKPHLVYRQGRKNVSKASVKPVAFESRGDIREELDSFRDVVEKLKSHEINSTREQSRPGRRRKRFLSYPRYVELMVTADAKMARHHGRNLEHYILTIMSVVSKVMFLNTIRILSLYVCFHSQLLHCNIACIYCSSTHRSESLETSIHLESVRFKNLERLATYEQASGLMSSCHEKQCKRLWCTSSEGDHKGCRTQHMPLADGTDCGHGMYCKHGMCVNKELDLQPVHGEWGPWGPYSVCSRSCGGGTRSAARDCNKPEPRNGGRFCVGRRMKFRSCNTEPCPRGRKDFREEQCSQFDGKHFNINGLTPSVHWVPKYSGIQMKDRCKLFCRVAGAMMYYQLKDRVIDGTPCGPDTYDICVQGLCRQAGCDHVLNSKARNDKCGVCGGDNSSCKTLAGTFNDAQYGYNTVVRIPAGATNIDIKQVSYSGKPEDDSYLALSDSQSNFLLNGNFVVSMFKREITLKGTVIEYSGSDTKVERINCTDRIEEELILQVLCVGNPHNPDVRYSFNIPIEEHREQFLWDPSGSWLECSRMCQGERRRKAVCFRQSDHLEVSDQRCEHLPRPVAVTEPCNADCEVRWHTAGKSDCSAKCGPGYRSLDIQCVKYSLLQRESERVEASACAEIPKPHAREPCHGDCLLKSWQYSAWSQCSKTCGHGSRSRESYCMNNLGRRLADRECGEFQRVVTETCNDLPCPQWTVNEWSECLVTCGKGMKHRLVTCMGGGEEKLSEQYCDSSTKPPAVESCQLPECASWQVGIWGVCAVTCGHGYQMRAVRCVLGDYGDTVDDRECNAAARPRDSQECEMPACPWISPVQSTPRPDNSAQLHTQWRYGSWTACSVSCGKGKQARYVTCINAQGAVADESYCAHLPRPPEFSTCFSPCGQWHAREWSACSVTCGVGRATRHVVCSNYHHPVDQSFCDSDDKPAAEQECTAGPCPSVYNRQRIYEQPYGYPQDPGHHPGHSSWNVPSADNQWRTGPWGACSSTCEGGFQRRVVVCQDGDGRSNSYCDERIKPAESKSCDSGPCPLWNYGVWGECTQTCGGGRRTRLVVCQRPNGQTLIDYNCDMLDKPPDMEQCNLQPCPGSASWHRQPWKPCSASCGRGIKQREIACVYQNQTKIEEAHCSHLQRPRTQKPCRARVCPTWKTSRWRECNVSCGDGTRSRKVWCAGPDMTPAQNDYCEPSSRPPSVQSCTEAACQYVWVAGEWSQVGVCSFLLSQSFTKSDIAAVVDLLCFQCSASCGIGYQQRYISCSMIPSSPGLHAQTIISAGKCSEPHPPDTRPCVLQECASSAYWKVGPWSKCSQTCGAGLMERRVECVTFEGQTSKVCRHSERPASQAACQDRQCQLFTSCREVQMRQGVRMDGEYYLKVKSRILQIYCAEMQTDFPKEYVTLRSGQTDNYSEVYGYRLLNPFECPNNGSRLQDCSCRNDYSAAGYTLFHKVRLDLSSLRIMITDLQFSQTLLGRPVPFATAGDCYSAAKCPQGQFSINLTGTGLKVSHATKWTSQGNYVSVKVHRSEDGTRIYGRCGGFCGKCIPQAHNGLLLQVH
uniref:ADAM metallopeptidase with thrombospondin type 1 motif 20 n=1 Tax=Oryzias melastigma TaxID=30732 RepID=A0A3B3BUW3_ORYME